MSIIFYITVVEDDATMSPPSPRYRGHPEVLPPRYAVTLSRMPRTPCTTGAAARRRMP
jgi:hypothetical protein